MWKIASISRFLESIGFWLKIENYQEETIFFFSFLFLLDQGILIIFRLKIITERKINDAFVLAFYHFPWFDIRLSNYIYNYDIA